MTDSRKQNAESGFPPARQKRTRWPGWVWLIPASAIIFAAWMSAQEFLFGPQSLHVHFTSVEGIKPGAPVRYRGVQVGSVDEITLDDDLSGATLVLDMTGLEGHLGPGTRIWIERPGLAPGEIGNLISGPYLAIAPDGTGDSEQLEGLDRAPILEPDEPGAVFVLIDEEGEGPDAGAPVRFRGMEVGRVLGKRFGEDGLVEHPVFVEGEYAGLVHEATVFWRAGGLALDTGAGGLDVALPSFSAMATGAIAFDTPEVLEGDPAEPGARFSLWDSRDDAETAATGPRVAYGLVFAEPVGGLAQGAPVTLAGKRVGRVAGTELEVAPDGSGLVTPVTVVIDARRMGIDDLDALETPAALRERMNAIIERLVSIGMRAQVAEGGIVFGGRSIELVIDSGQPPGALAAGEDPPLIPTADALAGRAVPWAGRAGGEAAGSAPANGAAGRGAQGASAGSGASDAGAAGGDRD